MDHTVQVRWRGGDHGGGKGNGSRRYNWETKVAAARDHVENGLTKTEAMARHGIASIVDWQRCVRRFLRGQVPVRNSFGLRYPRADRFYGVDLEIRARESMSLKVTDPVRFVRNFVPATTVSYSFDDEGPRRQILSEFVQSFIVAINSLSNEYRISQLLGKANDIAACVRGDRANAGTWNDRFGFEVFSVGIESIELTEQSRQLVQQFASNRMNVAAYEGVSQQAGNMAAQQRIAQGIQDNGFGDGGMLLGMNMAQAINPMTAAPVQAPAPTPAPEAAAPASHTASMSVEEQVEAMKK